MELKNANYQPEAALHHEAVPQCVGHDSGATIHVAGQAANCQPVAALHEYLSLVATILETANRVGAPTDQPEGSQYIMLSHTLAMQIACKLRDFATPIYVTVIGPPQPGELRNTSRPEE